MIKIIDQYQLQERLGSDHLGLEIYKARHNISKEYYTLKIMGMHQFLTSRSIRQKIQNQAKILKRLQHTNIIKYIKMLKTTKNLYLVYEFCDKGTLQENLSKSTHSVLINYMWQLTIVLRQLHKKNIVLNNFNPKSIYIKSSNNTLKLTNFTNYQFVGIKNVATQEHEITFSSSAETLIKENEQDEYLAPEMKKYPHMPPTFQSDIYILGILLHSMFFGSISEINIIKDNSITYDTKNSDRYQLRQIIKKMLHNDPQKRISLEEILNSRLFNPSNSSPKSVLSKKSPQYLTVSSSEKSSQHQFAISTKKFRDYKTMQNINKIEEDNSIYRSLKKEGHRLMTPLLKIPPKKERRVSSQTQSQTESSILNEKSNRSDTKFFQIVHKITLQRTKYNFLMILVNETLELKLNEISSKLIFILFKKALQIANQLAYSISKNDNFLALNITTQKNSKQPEYLIKIIIKEVEQLNQSFKIYRETIIQERKRNSNDKNNNYDKNNQNFEIEFVSDDTVNELYFREVIKEYTNSCIEITKKMNDEQQQLKRVMLHLNNVSNCLQFKQFFVNYINQSILKITDQIYFQEMQKLSNRDLMKMIRKKIML